MVPNPSNIIKILKSHWHSFIGQSSIFLREILLLLYIATLRKKNDSKNRINFLCRFSIFYFSLGFSEFFFSSFPLTQLPRCVVIEKDLLRNNLIFLKMLFSFTYFRLNTKKFHLMFTLN